MLVVTDCLKYFELLIEKKVDMKLVLDSGEIWILIQIDVHLIGNFQIEVFVCFSSKVWI